MPIPTPSSSNGARESAAVARIDAFYMPLNDISSSKGKIGGAAQKRLSSGAVLHHVTMAYDMDAEKNGQGPAHRPRKLSDKGTTSAVKRVDPLSQPDRPAARGKSSADEGDLVSLNGGTPGTISDEEYAAAE